MRLDIDRTIDRLLVEIDGIDRLQDELDRMIDKLQADRIEELLHRDR